MPTMFEEAVRRVAEGFPADREASRLVAEMSLEEKLGCLDGDTPFWEGVIDAISGGYYEHTYPAAVTGRLGIPGLHFSDGPRGVVVGHCTAFPVSMARGASFDPDLEERIGDAIGRELRAVGATFYGGVCVNLLRHPAWGRAQETYGEDPYHVGEMGAALTRGVQAHVMACVKHFACNSIENARFQVDVSADERALHEVYLPHFRRIVLAGVASVMSAYNSLNGEWCGQNRELLTGILREEWNFSGFVISDFQFGLRDAVKSVAAGLDIEMPYVQQRAQHLPEAVADGRLPIALVDDAVRRIVATFLRFSHVFEGRYDSSVIACGNHRALAHEAARASLVLLRNEGGVLPLSGVKRLAVIGRLASIANLGDGGSSNVHPPTVVTPLAGLQEMLAPAEVIADDGSQAEAVAAQCDAAVVVVGYTSEEEGEYIDNAAIGGLLHLFPPMTDPATGDRLRDAVKSAAASKGFKPGGDRAALTLSEADEELILKVAAANPRTVVVIMGGSAIVIERWRKRVPAIVMLWYPGMEGGHALAEILLGRINPSGRLPFAVPTDASHLVPFDRNALKAEYDLLHGQWLLDRNGLAAAYPFGFGLSYTRFALSDSVLVSSGSTWRVRVRVTNTGERAGKDLVLVYGGVRDSRFERPLRRLLGFGRIELSAGESAELEVPISPQVLAVRQEGRWQMEPGSYELTICHDAAMSDGEVCRLVLEHP